MVVIDAFEIHVRYSTPQGIKQMVQHAAAPYLVPARHRRTYNMQRHPSPRGNAALINFAR